MEGTPATVYSYSPTASNDYYLNPCGPNVRFVLGELEEISDLIPEFNANVISGLHEQTDKPDSIVCDSCGCDLSEQGFDKEDYITLVALLIDAIANIAGQLGFEIFRESHDGSWDFVEIGNDWHKEE